MKNLKYTQPFSVDMVFFTGDRGIRWFKGKFDVDQRNHIIQLIKLKLIQAVREFRLTAEDLGLVKIKYEQRAETPLRVSVERSSPVIQFNSRTPIPIITKQKVGGIRYG